MNRLRFTGKFAVVVLVLIAALALHRRMTEDEFEQKRLALEDVMRFGTTLEKPLRAR